MKILQHCFGKADSGGPVKALGRLLESSELSYGELVQEHPAGGVNFRLIFRFISGIDYFGADVIHIRARLSRNGIDTKTYFG